MKFRAAFEQCKNETDGVASPAPVGEYLEAGAPNSPKTSLGSPPMHPKTSLFGPAAPAGANPNKISLFSIASPGDSDAGGASANALAGSYSTTDTEKTAGFISRRKDGVFLLQYVGYPVDYPLVGGVFQSVPASVSTKKGTLIAHRRGGTSVWKC